jgi:putative choline sulfate-utilization transcription factor
MATRPVDLGWMRVFEAVARLGSLTAAAAELGLTQPAVSYVVRTLEAQVGTALLERGSRGSRPTGAGHQLLRALAPAIRDIDGAVREIRSRGRRPVVRLFTDFGFASFWMMPRMAKFRATAPDVEVHIVASASTDPGTADAMDVAVLFGARSDVPPGALQLLPERVVPVCSPAFAAATGILADPGAFAHLPLLHLESTPNPRWFAWRDWLAAQGIERRAGSGDLGLNTYGLVVQAAIADQGLALGWSGLIDGALADGTLIAVGPPLVNPDSGYWLIPNEPLTPPAAALARWIHEAATGDPEKDP